jgi:flagellar motility protein MotE (MotC chaperone)
MVLLFKHNGSSSKVPLEVGGTNFAQHYSGVNKSMAWDELEPSIRQCTEKFVIPFIGEELYADLSEKFQENALATSAQRKIVQHLQDCIAFYAIYHILPEKTGVLASMGVVPNNGNAPTITQWAWRNKRADALSNADYFLEKALSFLEKQVIDEVPYFDLYKNSAAYNFKTSAFFRRTVDLDEYLNIQNSRRTFASIIGYIRAVEQDYILPLLCEPLFSTMADPETASTTDPVLKKLLIQIKKASAFMGLSEAVPHHRVIIEPNGFRFVSEIEGYDQRAQQSEEQSNIITDLRQKSVEKGRKALAEALNILRNNESTFPTWTSSPCYSQVPDIGHTLIVSPNGKGGIGIF